MVQQTIDKLKREFEGAIEYLKNELKSLQIGRATPSLVENLEVDCYGQKMTLKQIAAIQVPEPRVIAIRPWDKSSLQAIEKAISQSKLNLNPIVEGDTVRLNIPSLNEDRRRELAKIVGERAEECHINVRRHREEAWKEIQTAEQAGKISEDDRFRAKEKLQKLVDEYNDKIDALKKSKEEEIMKV